MLKSHLCVSVSLCRSFNQFLITAFPYLSQVMSILATNTTNMRACIESGLVTIFYAWFHIDAPK